MAAITRIGSEKEGMFSLNEEAKVIGSLTYTIADGSRMIIEHTKVEQGHEGKGCGKLLIDAAAEFARSHSYKITAACSYANAVMKRSHVYSDLLA